MPPSELFCFVGVGLIVGTIIMILRTGGDATAGQIIKMIVAAFVVGGIIILISISGSLPGPSARGNMAYLKGVFMLSGIGLIFGALIFFFVSAAADERDTRALGCLVPIILLAFGGFFLWIAFS